VPSAGILPPKNTPNEVPFDVTNLAGRTVLIEQRYLDRRAIARCDDK
jgi:hypothetical protein